ncbi:MAG: hydantoinase B/oxoprolinase family protein, partial [Verrucomicrobiota bacterium]
QLDDDLPLLDMRLATTRGTNALLEGKGAKTAFFVTEGFGDLLRIGNQQRPHLFELGIRKADPVYDQVFEIKERLGAGGEVLVELDEAQVRECIEKTLQDGFEAVAVAFVHSYENPDHELRVEALLKEAGIRRVSVSSALSPFIKVLPRAETANVDAYLSPIMDAYLDAVQRRLSGGKLRVMNSAGGLASRDRYCPKDSLLSGPAGGVVGSSSVGLRGGEERTIAFDMGGTSTDVSRFDGGLDYKFEQRIGAARVYAPSLRIETVAAGGGSVCWFDGMASRVGPQSAGAYPGPACYGAGGPLTITDVNLLLGRLDPSHFNIPVKVSAARESLGELLKEVESKTGLESSEESFLHGFLAIANERMAEAIRSISLSEGYDTSEYAMVAFGGAGGLHACAVAGMLSMKRVLFPADSGLLSAYGLKRASIERFEEKQILESLELCETSLQESFELLQRSAIDYLAREGEELQAIELGTRRCEMRYRGQESSLQIDYAEGISLKNAFEEAYRFQFGFVPEGLEIEVVALRLSVRTKVEREEAEEFSVVDTTADQLRGFAKRGSLKMGQKIVGPIVVQDSFSTVFVDTGWEAIVGTEGTLLLERIADAEVANQSDEVVELELFTNRFLSIVEEMGALLERTAFSTNVKERRDFSCALLDREGRLVANAPHIPVHLGALGVCLRKVLEERPLNPGDVIVTNHPGYGGSHLPDVTFMAGVYSEDGDLIGYVANRAHHAELGGISPGSMPPEARSLEEEGVVIAPMYLMRNGEARWKEVEEVLLGGKYPTRGSRENVADLSAQLASIRIGQEGLKGMTGKEGVGRVCGYLEKLRKRAASALRSALKREELAKRSCVERLDSGAEICVSVWEEDGKFIVDFEGSAGAQGSNYNATAAIVTSATIYVMRLLAKVDVPLNEGFLDVVDIRIPEGMLNPVFDDDPAKCPPVVAGNVEVSQRVVDALLKVFGLAACSQGTMNNLIFGNQNCSYYETIAGGEGATSERPGADGVHTHMTNTAITDPEIFEKRYPARLEKFGLREGSGGAGRFSGGEGVARRIRFLEAVKLSMLTQHRRERPYGMEGGEAGQCGEQFLIRAKDGSKVALGENVAIDLEAGDLLEVRTPGGGGWGRISL